MKFKNFSFLILFILSACAPAPQVTDTPEATATLLPASPTLESTSTPEPTTTPTAETVTIGGVTMTVGENGVVTDMKVEGKYTDAQKAEKMAAVYPTKWGYKNGETQIRVEGPTNRFLEVIDGTEVVRVAQWDFGSNEWLWDGTMMEHIPLFDGFAKTYPVLDSGNVLVTNEVRADATEIISFTDKEMAKLGNIKSIYTIYLYNSSDKTEAIIARLFSREGWLDATSMLRNKEGATADGWICFKTESGKLVRMKFSDIEFFIRGFN